MLIESKDSSVLTECPHESAVITALSYFSIFHHPLKKEELKNFLPCTIGAKELDEALQRLIVLNKIKELESYWGLPDCISPENIKNRKSYELLFESNITKVIRNSRLIASFPFVRAVMISGSISKGLMKEDGDIDFFIITAHNRLWICRTLLILYKKIFRLNSKKYFCLNYFIGEKNLEIPDKNIFTATETACLVPTYNAALCAGFVLANEWYKSFLPAFARLVKFEISERRSMLFKDLLEKLLSGRFGEKLDIYLLNYTYKHWQKKFPAYTPELIDLALRSQRNVSKHHPNNFQEKVLRLLDEKIKSATV